MTATATVDLVTDTTGVAVSAAEFLAALRDADLARGRDDFRPGICCIRVARTGDSLIFTTTDSYMLLERTLPLTGDQPDGDWTVLIAGADVPVLVAHVKGLQRGAAIGITVDVDGAVTVVAEGRILRLAQPDAEFPSTDLWPTGEATGAQVALNPRFLARLDRLSESKSALNPARFSLFGDLKPVLIEIGQHTRVLLMPVRISA